MRELKGQMIKTGAWTWLPACVYCVILSVLYFSTIRWLITADWAREDYSYSYFIPPIVLYLIWQKRAVLAAIPSTQTWTGLPVLLIGMLLFWVGELSGEFFSLYISLWLSIVGICWLHMGWKKMKAIIFPLGFSLVMFPLPHYFMDSASFRLKLISSKIGVFFMHLVGMSAYRDGNIIDLGFTQLQVVDACSGLRYLIPLIVLSILVAYHMKDPLWKRLTIIASSIPLSIVTNSLRIALTGILFKYFGEKIATGFLHDFSGWFIFMTSFGILYLEIKLMRKVKPVHVISPNMADSSSNSLSRKEQPSSVPMAGVSLIDSRFIIAALLMIVTITFSWGMEFREHIPIRKSLHELPLKIGGWSGERKTMDQRFMNSLTFSDYTLVDYQDPSGKKVDFYVAYYEKQTKGESIHTPATCLPGAGWSFRESVDCAIPSDRMDHSTFIVKKVLMENNGNRQVMYYWFPQRGRILTDLSQLKFYTFWDALTKKRTDGALVRMVTPIYEKESVPEAEGRLRSFAGAIVPLLPAFIPD
jgi:exosortase D (VPLPA-CTERM-specific)